MQHPFNNSRKWIWAYLLVVIPVAVFSQHRIHCVVADSSSGQPLSFSTIHTGSTTVIAGIDGAFTLLLKPEIKTVTVSYTGYASREIIVTQLAMMGTVWLMPRSNSLGEVVVRPNADKVKRIVNTPF
jgi:hypothetical protein